MVYIGLAPSHFGTWLASRGAWNHLRRESAIHASVTLAPRIIHVFQWWEFFGGPINSGIAHGGQQRPLKRQRRNLVFLEARLLGEAGKCWRRGRMADCWAIGRDSNLN